MVVWYSGASCFPKLDPDRNSGPASSQVATRLSSVRRTQTGVFKSAEERLCGLAFAGGASGNARKAVDGGMSRDAGGGASQLSADVIQSHVTCQPLEPDGACFSAETQCPEDNQRLAVTPPTYRAEIDRSDHRSGLSHD